MRFWLDNNVDITSITYGLNFPNKVINWRRQKHNNITNNINNINNNINNNNNANNTNNRKKHLQNQNPITAKHPSSPTSNSQWNHFKWGHLSLSSAALLASSSFVVVLSSLFSTLSYSSSMPLTFLLRFNISDSAWNEWMSDWMIWSPLGG